MWVKIHQPPPMKTYKICSHSFWCALVVIGDDNTWFAWGSWYFIWYSGEVLHQPVSSQWQWSRWFPMLFSFWYGFYDMYNIYIYNYLNICIYIYIIISCIYIIIYCIYINIFVCSMYGIFTNIYPKHDPNVGKYTIYGACGYMYI